MIYVASISTIFAFGLGGVIGWIYRGTVDNLHPEFLDGNGAYVNEELLAVKFMDDELLLDEEED